MSTKRKVEALDAPAAAEEHVDKKAKPEMQWICLGPEELCDVHIIQDDLFGIKCAQMDIRRLKPAQANTEPLLHTLLDTAKADAKKAMEDAKKAGADVNPMAPFEVHLPPKLFTSVHGVHEFFSSAMGTIAVLKGVTVSYARNYCHAALALNLPCGGMLDFLESCVSELSPSDAIHLGKLYKRPKMVTVGRRALAKPGAVIPDHLKDECLKEWAPSVDVLDSIKQTAEAHITTRRTKLLYAQGAYHSANFHGDTDQLVDKIFNLLKLPTR